MCAFFKIRPSRSYVFLHNYGWAVAVYFLTTPGFLAAVNFGPLIEGSEVVPIVWPIVADAFSMSDACFFWTDAD